MTNLKKNKKNRRNHSTLVSRQIIDGRRDRRGLCFRAINEMLKIQTIRTSELCLSTGVTVWVHHKQLPPEILTLSCSACSSLAWLCSLVDFRESFLFSSSRLLCSMYLDNHSTTHSPPAQTHSDWQMCFLFTLTCVSTTHFKVLKTSYCYYLFCSYVAVLI